MGYESPGTGSNVIDYVEISTTGNAVDFGDTVSDFSMRAGISNGHGGLWCLKLM